MKNGRSPEFSHGIRIAAGVYLIYLGYQIMSGVMNGTSDNPVMFGLFAAAFVVFGLGSLISGLRFFWKRDHSEPESEEETEDSDQNKTES